MNSYFSHQLGFWMVELLGAAGIVYWAAHSSWEKPDGLIARLLRHRDRIWFAIMLLLVPVIVYHFLRLRWIWIYTMRGPTNFGTQFTVDTIIFNFFYGAIYGAAGCLFASSRKKEERFGFWMALTVAVVLIILALGLSTVLNSLIPLWRRPGNNVPVLLLAVLLVLAYVVWRASAGTIPAVIQDEPAKIDANKSGYNPAHTFIWLLVGLVPIPILLAVASSRTPDRSLVIPLLVICPLCNLCGGIGCLGGIKNIAVRIILGISLGALFFLLTLAVAIFQACSHMNI